jgi:tetratricopeptide (TPR) repeat protein
MESLDDETIAGMAACQYMSADRAAAALGDREPVSDMGRDALVEAAERAASLHAHREAVRLAQRAIEAGAEPVGALLELAAASANALGEAERADDLALRAAKSWAAAGDRTGELRALSMRGRIANENHAASRAVSLLTQVVGYDSTDFEPAMLDVAAELARALVLTDEAQPALDIVDRALPAAEWSQRMELVAHLLNTKGTAMVILGRIAEGVALLKGSLDIANRVGPVSAELRGLANLHYAVSIDDPREAVSILKKGLDRSTEFGEATYELYFLRQLMETLVQIGDVDEADALLDHPQLATKRGERVAEYTRGSIEAMRGDLASAAARFERLASQSTEEDPQWQRGEESMRPFLDLSSGRLDAAVDGALRIFDADPTAHFGLAIMAADAALLLQDPGRLAKAADAVDRVRARGRVIDAARLEVAASRAALDRDIETADRDFGQAIELWRQIDNTWQLACCLVVAARMLPDHPLSAARHEEGERLFAAMGGPTLLGRLTGTASADQFASQAPHGGS